MRKVFAVVGVCFILILAHTYAFAQSYKYGDYADEISIIQEALEELDLYYAEITGHYGQKTERAVKLFQKEYGLSQTGIADEQTLLRLYTVADLEEVPVVSESVGPTFSGSTVLRRNSSGSEVRRLQEALHALEFYEGTITGNYGGLTQEAVRLFQKKYDLNADGVAGPKTLSKIASLLGDADGTTPVVDSVKPTQTSSAVALLRQGMKGDLVEALQEDLTALDFYSGTITGSYGNLTKEAVRQFQREHGLSSDGVAGPKPLAKIKSELGEVSAEDQGTTAVGNQVTSETTQSKPAVDLDDVEKLNTEWTLRYSSRSGHVTRLQKALTALGYFTDKCDGHYGSKTEAAVIAYQKARGLTDDGVAGRATLRKINDDIENEITAQNMPVD